MQAQIAQASRHLKAEDKLNHSQISAKYFINVILQLFNNLIAPSCLARVVAVVSSKIGSSVAEKSAKSIQFCAIWSTELNSAQACQFCEKFCAHAQLQNRGIPTVNCPQIQLPKNTHTQ